MQISLNICLFLCMQVGWTACALLRVRLVVVLILVWIQIS
jgi:hypothetical protein